MTDSPELAEAIADYYRLEREEANAIQHAIDLGNQRADASRRAQELGWRG